MSPSRGYRQTGDDVHSQTEQAASPEDVKPARYRPMKLQAQFGAVPVVGKLKSVVQGGQGDDADAGRGLPQCRGHRICH